jgi:hypothetical protein
MKSCRFRAPIRAEHQVAGYRNPFRPKDLLGHRLVHRQRAGQYSGTGIGNPQQLQHALNSPIFSAFAVQGQNHHVRPMRRPRRDVCEPDNGQFARGGRSQCSRSRWQLRRRRVHQGRGIQRNRLVALWIQGSHYLAACREGYRPLCRGSSHQHRHAHFSHFLTVLKMNSAES